MLIVKNNEIALMHLITATIASKMAVCLIYFLVPYFQGKLVKLFSQQLVAKSKLKNGTGVRIPHLKQWLQIVGLGTHAVTVINRKISSVSIKCKCTDKDV